MMRSYVRLCVALAASYPFAGSAQAVRRPSFGGLQVAIDVARHNVIAGAQHGGIDVLHQVERVAATAGVGLRGQFANGTVVGVEIGAGPLSTQLQRMESAADIRVSYRGHRQRYLGGQVGQVVGASGRTLLYAYAYEVTRRFAVTIEGPFGGSSTFPIQEQNDEQGLLRFGVGAERIANSWLSVRGSAGTSRADFGDQVTNITVVRPLELQIGVVARLGARPR